MIESFATDTAKHLFEGRWELLLRTAGASSLEECFIDLRILDASVSKSDIETAFGDRISSASSQRKMHSYIVSSPDDCGGWYEIKFVWTGSSIADIDVLLAKSVAA